MHIAGPLFDPARRTSPKKWFLRYFAAELQADGTPKLNEAGKLTKKKHRPYYATKADAEADKPRIAAQYAVAGHAGGVLTGPQAEDYRAALAEVPEVSCLEMAKFWRRHHPRDKASTIRELTPKFLEWVKARLGQTRHYDDLKSRLDLFGKAGAAPGKACFYDRAPAIITRSELLAYLLTLGKGGRTVLNQKRAVVNFFNWLVNDAKVIESHELGGIKKRSLPKALAKEIAFLSLVEANRYLRACERYDPDIVAHEIIQLKAGVRADDEMEDFRGEWVKAETREILIPADVAKMERREVISGLEPNFWDWWREYGREGLLRVPNYEPRWNRVRVLARTEDRAQADELARLPIKTLLARPDSKTALEAWPWNARRRTFCTYKVAKDQSAGSAALILRHKGDAETLHNSYRGLGVTQEQGVAYFASQPKKIDHPIFPARPARGIVRLQLERAKPAQPPVIGTAVA